MRLHENVSLFNQSIKATAHHPADALLFREVAATWKQLQTTYINDFANLVYGKSPKPDEVLESLKEMHIKLASITWNITVEPNE